MGILDTDGDNDYAINAWLNINIDHISTLTLNS